MHARSPLDLNPFNGSSKVLALLSRRTERARLGPLDAVMSHFLSISGPRSGRAAIWGLAMLIGLFASACGTVGRVHAFPLYPGAEHPRAPESLARLEGPIQLVDALDVEANGTEFVFMGSGRRKSR